MSHLVIGCGNFGSFGVAQFINLLDEESAFLERTTNVEDTNVDKRRAALELSRFYETSTSGNAIPRAVIIDTAEHFGFPVSSDIPKSVNETEVAVKQVEKHPYQVYLEREDVLKVKDVSEFNLSSTVRYFSDILNNPLRPECGLPVLLGDEESCELSAEMKERVEDKLRGQLELSDHISQCLMVGSCNDSYYNLICEFGIDYLKSELPLVSLKMIMGRREERGIIDECCYYSKKNDVSSSALSCINSSLFIPNLWNYFKNSVSRDMIVPVCSFHPSFIKSECPHFKSFSSDLQFDSNSLFETSPIAALLLNNLSREITKDNIVLPFCPIVNASINLFDYNSDPKDLDGLTRLVDLSRFHSNSSCKFMNLLSDYTSHDYYAKTFRAKEGTLPNETNINFVNSPVRCPVPFTLTLTPKLANLGYAMTVYSPSLGSAFSKMDVDTLPDIENRNQWWSTHRCSTEQTQTKSSPTMQDPYFFDEVMLCLKTYKHGRAGVSTTIDFRAQIDDSIETYLQIEEDLGLTNSSNESEHDNDDL